jgi:hypothetical protein
MPSPLLRSVRLVEALWLLRSESLVEALRLLRSESPIAAPLVAGWAEIVPVRA